MLTKGALQGVTVLDLSRMLPGPYCSMILADHGAEVIAIEGKNFQGEALFFNDLNRNKRHMSLNLKTEEGLEIFYKLVQKADVIIEGFRPGVVKRLGIDYPSVKKVKNDIIYCSISGYGQTGELRDLAGHDVNYLSRSGILGLLGTRSGPPSIPGVQFADIAGGSMNAAVGILLALYARERDGEGQYIDISMTDGMIGFLTLPYYFSKRTGRLPEPSDTLLSHRYGCYNTYETSDKRFISIGAVEGKFWRNLCEILGLQEYASLQYDEERRDEIITSLRNLFLEKTQEEWIRLLSETETCFTPVQNLPDVFADPHFRERKMVFERIGDDGEAEYDFGIPVKMSRTPGKLRIAAEEFGEGTSDILTELGYSEKQVEDFFGQGIV